MAVIEGRSDLERYESMGPAIAVTIGVKGGAGQFPGQTDIAGPDIVSELKGRTLMVDRSSDLFGVTALERED